ncbi:MAG: hypothetical protein IJD97_03035 [Clostridia bacterium]|nr:hypothetical protein [Clostridia bacterium]
MILFFLGIATSILGIVGLFIEQYTLVYISAGFYVVETICGLITGELKNLGTTIFTICVSAIVAAFTSFGLLNSICVGLTIESAVMSILGTVFFFVSFK